ncbi:hypothetical protein BJX76DRAFT_358774 [Aspergillus varians]
MSSYNPIFTKCFNGTLTCPHMPPTDSSTNPIQMCIPCREVWEARKAQNPQGRLCTITESNCRNSTSSPANPASPCTDFATMCDYCWGKWEAGETQSPDTIGPCTPNGPEMCDFCWRAYEIVGNQELVVQSTDPCLDPATMCNLCRHAFKINREHTPEQVLIAKSGTYPVKFFCKVDPRYATRDYAKNMGHTIAKNLAIYFGKKVHVHAASGVPGGEGQNRAAGAWVLVDFPEVVALDAEMRSMLFANLPGVSGRWVVQLPPADKCVSWWRMGWFTRKDYVRWR